MCAHRNLMWVLRNLMPPPPQYEWVTGFPYLVQFFVAAFSNSCAAFPKTLVLSRHLIQEDLPRKDGICVLPCHITGCFHTEIIFFLSLPDAEEHSHSCFSSNFPWISPPAGTIFPLQWGGGLKQGWKLLYQHCSNLLEQCISSQVSFVKKL